MKSRYMLSELGKRPRRSRRPSKSPSHTRTSSHPGGPTRGSRFRPRHHYNLARQRVAEIFKNTLLATVTFLTVFTLPYMFVSSLKTTAQFATEFWALIPFQTGISWLKPLEISSVHWDNYSMAAGHVFPYMVNTLFIAIAVITGTLFFASLSAYAFARMRFRFKNFLFYAILSLMMVPGVLTLVPSVILVRDLGLFNTYGALILPAIAGGQVFAIFILRGFFAGLPEDYFAAARVDGASELQIYWHIALPLSKPIIATISIMIGLGVWNDFIWPLLVASDESLRTVSVGLQYFRWIDRIEVGQLMAGNVLASLPLILLFAFASGTFVKGLSTGGIKA